MISQIFISPDTFEDTNSFISINCLLNDIYNSPIFIIDFDTVNWVKYIKRHYIDNIYNGNERDILVQKLHKLDRSRKIFKRNNYEKEIVTDQDWLEVVNLSDQEKSLDLVVSGKKCINEYREKFADKTEYINELVIFPAKWDIIKMTDTEVKKTPTDYRRAFGDILINSKQLKIIDPYIGSNFKHDINRPGEEVQLRNDDKQIIELFSELLASNRVGNGIIEIHTILDKQLDTNHVLPRDKHIEKIEEIYNNDDRFKMKRENWEVVIKKYAELYGHTYKVYFWSNRNEKSTFHDRYIFTDLIAISPNHSISATEYSDQDTLWKVLNRIEREKQEAKYDIDDIPYFIPSCEPIEVDPNE